MTLQIVQLPVLDDNYIYLIHDVDTKKTAAVDPALAQPVLEELDRRGWSLSYILNTHHHWDHVGGNTDLVKATGCRVIGPIYDKERIPHISQALKEGDHFELGQSIATVLYTPGHTRGHIVFWFEADQALFVGDTLFAMGCGRLFEGSPKQMWTSLQKIIRLPEETKIYCAHEYTLKNAKFSLTIEPDNPALKKRYAHIKELRANDEPTIPTTIGEELETNPFLRVDLEGLRTSLNCKDPVEAFAKVRGQRDMF